MADRHEAAGLNSLQFQDNTTRKEYSWYDRPHEELVADIREAAFQARAGWEKEHEKGQPFDPAVWAGQRLMPYPNRTFSVQSTAKPYPTCSSQAQHNAGATSLP